jgi:probable rRNA maturation factor
MRVKMLTVEFDIAKLWPEGDWQKLGTEAANAAIAITPYASIAMQSFTAEISVKLTDSDEIQKLNKDYRAKDKPTNVLSFPLVERDTLGSLSNSDDEELLLGDIILSYEVCAKETTEKQIDLTAHVTHLFVHGTLHLLGYDHEIETDAIIMEALETRAMQNLRLPDPYSGKSH